MDQIATSPLAGGCSPVFSLAGVMPGSSEMAWKTSYPNPDALIAPARAAGHGPSFSVAGVMPGVAETAWRTAMPDPSRDTLDVHGHVITKVEAGARAQLTRGAKVVALPLATAAAEVRKAA